MADYPATRSQAESIIRENFAKYGSKPWALAKIFNNGQEKWVVSYLAAEDPFCSPYIEVLEDCSAEIEAILARTSETEPGDERLDSLIETLRAGRDQSARLAAAETLGELGDGRAVEPLIATLREPDPTGGLMSVSRAAASALGKLGDARAVMPLVEALKARDGLLRDSAVCALGEIGDERAVDPLLASLTDANEWVRAQAARALGELGDRRAVAPLAGALGDEKRHVRVSAATALEMIGAADAIAPLMVALSDEDADVRAAAAGGLKKFGDTRAVQPLIIALKDERAGVRKTAAAGLKRIGDARAVSPLTEALGDQSTGVRKAAAAALKAIGERASTPDPGSQSHVHEVADASERLDGAEPRTSEGWRYRDGSGEFGPMSWSDLWRAARRGDVVPTTQVQHQAFGGWRTAGDFPSLFQE